MPDEQALERHDREEEKIAPADRREERPRVLVSRCLLGDPVRFDGHAKPLPEAALKRLRERAELVPVCPEQAGGLPTPRPPAEITGGSGEDVHDGRARVCTRQGRDVTEAFVKGARKAVRMAHTHGCRLALLKENSPSCGCTAIHDGTHTGTLRPGCGVTTAALRAAGIRCHAETELESLLEELSELAERSES